MPTIRVIKRGGFRYGPADDRQLYGLGKELVAKQKDARMLVAAKLAEYVDDAEPVAKPKAATRTAAAKTTTTRKAATRYNRRDMKAK